jgi:hypothetical protein
MEKTVGPPMTAAGTTNAANNPVPKESIAIFNSLQIIDLV